MKPRSRRLSNLWFRYGKDRGLDAEEVAEALEVAGLIERLERDRYREVEQKPRLKLEAFEKLVSEALARYLTETKGGGL